MPKIKKYNGVVVDSDIELYAILKKVGSMYNLIDVVSENSIDDLKEHLEKRYNTDIEKYGKVQSPELNIYDYSKIEETEKEYLEGIWYFIPLKDVQGIKMVPEYAEE